MKFESTDPDCPVLGEVILFYYLHEDTFWETDPNEALEKFLFDAWRNEMRSKFKERYLNEIINRLREMLLNGEVDIEDVGMINMDGEEGEMYG